jgi:hypothetical protein
VIAAIRARHKQGLGLGQVRNDDPSLFYAGIRYFGGWREAVLAAGLQPVSQHWTPVRVINEIQSWYQRGIAIRQIARQDRKLAAAGIRHFGKWNAALTAAGLNADAAKQPHGRQKDASRHETVRHSKVIAPTNEKGHAACLAKRSFVA